MKQPIPKTAKMRNCILTLLLVTIFSLPARAQCPNSSFTTPAGICQGQPFTLVNSSDPGMQYAWDMNPGDMERIPTGINLGSFSLSAPRQVKAVISNGNRYLFVCNEYGSEIHRFDFGNSYNNTPTFHNYGNFTGFFTNPNALDVINENGNWYIFVAAWNNSIYRVDLGSDISQNTATHTVLGSSFGLNSPTTMKIIKESGNYYAFIINSQSSNITRIDFGTSIINNTPTSVSLPVTGLSSAFGFDMAFDCVLNKYVGYISQENNDNIRVLDFGASLTNMPVEIGLFSTQAIPKGIHLVRDGISWYLLVTSRATGALQIFRIGPTLSNIQPVSISQNIIGNMSWSVGISVINDNSENYAFVTNAIGGNTTLTQIQWPDSLPNSPAISDAADSVTVISSGTGLQYVMLSVTNTAGYTSHYVDSFYVNISPSTLYFTGTSCDGIPVQFTDSSSITGGSITGWEWDFGDSSPPDFTQNPIHLFPGSGTYNVQLTTSSDSGCTHTYSTQVSVYDNPTADFTFTNNQCQFAPVTFTDQTIPGAGTSIINWDWDFGDGTPVIQGQNQSHPYSVTGSFQVQLITTTDVGCDDTISKNINIIPAPAASFSVSSTCINDSAVFTNSTTITGGGSIGYEWDFGDSYTSIQMDPVHFYLPVAANYNVALIATASNGCKDTIIENIRISNRPIAQFSFTPSIVCQGNAVWFSNSSTGTGGDTISAQLWNFGDLNSSTDLNPVHFYADTGYYNVTLTVTSPTSCDSSIAQQLYVIPGPTATFNATQVCLTQSTSFSPIINTPPGTTIDSIVWNFGDSSLYTGITSPVHTYSSPGTYIVTMTVYNNLLCTYTYIDSVEVFPLPIADFSNSLACSGSPVTFNGSLSQVSGDSITSWLWDFNGMGVSIDTFPEFTFMNPGVFDITLVVTTSHGCSDTLQNQLTIIQSPDYYYTYNNPCLGSNTNFNYHSNVLPEPPANLLWNFGDGSLSTALSPIHLFTAVDTFTVTLTVTDPGTGCTTTKDSLLIVYPLPTPGFVSQDICEDIPRIFTDTSEIATGTIVNWNWNFGTLGTSNLQHPVITPQNPGSYVVTLLLTSDKGCSSSMMDSINVFARPMASFTTDPIFGSPPFSPTFINNTTGATQFLWDFGDGSSGTGISPAHSYSDTGFYQLSLIAISDQSCLDTAYHAVTVLFPYLDLTVMNVYAGSTSTNTKLTAQLANTGNIAVTSATLRGFLYNESVITEQWAGNLLPGDVTLYEFVSSYANLPSSKNGYICIESILVNDTTDENSTNNKKCSSLSSAFEILSIYPSPFINELNVQFNLANLEHYNIRIYDITGKIAFQKLDQSGYEGYNTFKIQTESLNKGLYVLQLQSGDDILTEKITKY